MLPFPSAINSLDWSSFPELAAGVGEVYGETRNYNGAKVIPYAHGLTPCQPAEVFAEGEVFDPSKPPQVYDELHFPTCCLDRFTVTGGILWGGTAGVNVLSVTGTGAACYPVTPPNTPFTIGFRFRTTCVTVCSVTWIESHPPPTWTPFRVRLVSKTPGAGRMLIDYPDVFFPSDSFILTNPGDTSGVLFDPSPGNWFFRFESIFNTHTDFFYDILPP